MTATQRIFILSSKQSATLVFTPWEMGLDRYCLLCFWWRICQPRWWVGTWLYRTALGSTALGMYTVIAECTGIFFMVSWKGDYKIYCSYWNTQESEREYYYAEKVGINWSIWSSHLESHGLFYKSHCLLIDCTLLFYSYSFCSTEQILGRKKYEQIFDKEQWDG